MPVIPGNPVSGTSPTRINVDENFPRLLANPAMLQIIQDAANTIGETYQQLLSQIADHFNQCNDTLQNCYANTWRYLVNQLQLNGNQVNNIFLAVTQDIAGQVNTFTSGFAPLLQLCYTDIHTICQQMQPGTFSMFNNIIPPKPDNWPNSISYGDWTSLATRTYILDSSCAMAFGVRIGPDAQLFVGNRQGTFGYNAVDHTIEQVKTTIDESKDNQEWQEGMPYEVYRVVDCSQGVPTPETTPTQSTPPATVTQTNPTTPTTGIPSGTLPTQSTVPPVISPGPITIPVPQEQTTPNIPCSTPPATIIVQPAPVTVVNQQVSSAGEPIVASLECTLPNLGKDVSQGELIDQYLCLIGAPPNFVTVFGDIAEGEEDSFEDKNYTIVEDYPTRGK